MPVKHVVLGILAGGESHGYGIGERLRKLRAVFRPPESARLYSILVALEADGLIVAREEPSDSGRSRRVFQLTSKGARELERWLGVPVAVTEWLRRPLLARVALCGDPGVVSVVAWRSEAEARRRRLAAIRGRRPAATPLERLADARARRHLEIEVELLERVIALATAPAEET